MVIHCGNLFKYSEIKMKHKTAKAFILAASSISLFSGIGQVNADLGTITSNQSYAFTDERSLEQKLTAYYEDKDYKKMVSNLSSQQTSADITSHLSKADEGRDATRYIVFWHAHFDQSYTPEVLVEFGGMKVLDPSKVDLNHNIKHLTDCRDDILSAPKTDSRILQFHQIQKCAKKRTYQANEKYNQKAFDHALNVAFKSAVYGTAALTGIGIVGFGVSRIRKRQEQASKISPN